MAKLYLFSVALVFSSCFIINIQGEENVLHRNSHFDSASFFDVIHGAAMTAQHDDYVIDEEMMRLAESFSDTILDLFQYVRSRKFAEKREINNNPTVYDVTDDEDDNIRDNNADLILEKVLEKIQDLEYSDANNNLTSKCINDTGRLVVNLLIGEGWATQFLDATGKPGPALIKKHFNFVGDYAQCIEASAPAENGNNSFWKGKPQQGFTGSYCVIGVFLGSPTFIPQIGACLPSSCSSKEVSILMTQLLNSTSKMPIVADCRPAPTKMTTATVFAIIILVTVGFMMILGTSYDFLMISQTKLSKAEESSNQNGGHSSSRYAAHHEEKTDSAFENNENTPLVVNSENNKSSLFIPGTPSPWAKVLLAFSVYSNGKKILNTSQAPGSLGSIHGIRFLSMSWVVMCHFYGYISPSYSLNSIETTPMLFQRWTFLPIANGFVCVDTFFTLSGLLTSYLTIKEMTRRNSWNINWPLFYFHRFWRLTPPYMFSLVIVLGLTQYLGEGPLWPNHQPADKTFCEKNWWTNLLYVNNFVNTKEPCFSHAWYLANDMQFFVLSPLMIVPFFFHRIAGMVSCLVFLFISTVTTGILSSEQNWPSTMLSANPAAADWEQHYYAKPWCRIGPFIVGIFAGYILAQSKGRPFRMSPLIVVAGWITAFAAGLAVVYGLRGDITTNDVSSTGAAALYNAVSRTVWGACVSWVIIACSAGYGGPIQTLLSWSPFVFLGRLTYMAYLIHLCILGVFFGNLGSLLYANDTTLVVIYLGLLVIVMMAAFVAGLALESPMLGLEKAFIKRGKPEVEMHANNNQGLRKGRQPGVVVDQDKESGEK